ncbi:hypothetical protein IE53DRAFT_390765 [Violaceomyces palustris]|uniref:Uncharacterized protein n=1 Tax=Violaceomyces palustris TaxID=1673888 RepID=A0ACD0NMN1_9BASI|nr:hypothetical protein IE53DRAFT_390765 [Violaceomyces palustris]
MPLVSSLSRRSIPRLTNTLTSAIAISTPSFPKYHHHHHHRLEPRLGPLHSSFSSSSSPPPTKTTTTMSTKPDVPNAPGWSTEPNPYPPARRSDASSTYRSAKHGQVVVPEPYDWLEQPPSQSQETRQWTLAQDALTRSYLQGCDHLPTLQQRLEKNFNYARSSCPSLKGDGNYYYSYNSGLEPQSLIYRATPQQLAEAKAAGGGGGGPVGDVFFDTNLLSKDGTVALSLTSFSKSGKQMAYGISKAGSDWFSIYFRSTDKPFALPPSSYLGGQPQPAQEERERLIDPQGGADRHADVLENIKFSGAAWTHDDQGVFYQTYPDTSASDKGTETDANKDARLWYHRLGTPQSQDALVIDADRKTPSSMWSPTVSDDGEWLIVQNPRDTDTKQRVFVASLVDQPIGGGGNGSFRWIPLAVDFKYELGYITNDGNRFYFVTNKDASNYRVVYADLDASKAVGCHHVAELEGPDVELHDLVPEDPEALLSSATVLSNDKLLLVYSRDVKDELYQHELATGRRVARLMPDLVGTIGQIAGRREDDQAFVQSVSFVNPGVVTRIEWRQGSDARETPSVEEVYSETKVEGIRAEDFVSKQVFFPSKDGTRIPMFITHPKDVRQDGSAPAILYFYGGFNISLPPTFSPSMMTWISSYGGVLAFVNCRGGGEYGDKWHEAGSLLNKQNVFDDALTASKYLHEEGYAKKGKIILCGGSNGGLGVAACVNQAEEEHGVGAGIADVGVMDMLKFHTWTIGKAWTADYGNPSEDPVQFDYNLSYSPLHNVNPDKIYPTLILACADHDDRVVPAHSFKLAAQLQHLLPSNPNPLLLRVDMDAGHGAGKSTQKRIQEAAEKYSIVGRALGLGLVKGRSSL